jgi:hypothetical protein
VHSHMTRRESGTGEGENRVKMVVLLLPHCTKRREGHTYIERAVDEP